jgi:hypothetical protein
MVESLAMIMSQFPGEANRARCLAHIVNLVAKIILRQFDTSKGKKKKRGDEPEFLNHPVDNVAEDAENNEDDNEEDEGLDEEEQRVLDKEEKEMDEGDDEEDDEDAITLAKDVEIMEAVMEEEIEKATKKGKPVRQVLFKVSRLPSFFFLSSSFLLPFFFFSHLLLSFDPPLSFFFWGFRSLTFLLLYWGVALRSNHTFDPPLSFFFLAFDPSPFFGCCVALPSAISPLPSFFI